MGGFEQLDRFKKPKGVTEAIKNGDTNALSAMGQAGARARIKNAAQDALYEAFQRDEDQKDRQKNADQRRDHLVEDL